MYGEIRIPTYQNEWLQEFRENLVGERVPEHRDSHASSSHELSLEPHPRDVRIWVRTVFILVPRAANLGDLLTADHNFLSDNCESRNNHRYAVVVPGSSHSMDPGVSVQKQNFTRNPEKLAKVLGAR